MNSFQSNSSVERIGNYYTATLNDNTLYPCLDGDVTADVAIVGGGFTGVATAVELAERGLSVVLVEANRIGWGATGRNGGQVTGSLSGDKAMHKQLEQQTGSDADSIINMLRWHGHDIIKHRIERYGIDCHLKYGHLYTAWRRQDVASLQAFAQESQQAGLGEDVSWLSQEQVHEYLDTPLYHGGILNKHNMHLHSLNLCVGEARAAASLGVRIHEHSPVINIQQTGTPRVYTKKGSITAATVVIAGNAYHQLCQQQLGGQLFPAILGNLVTTPLSDELAHKINPHDVAVYDSRMILDYFRLTHDKRLMFGGGTNYSGRDINDVATQLRPALERTFPALQGIEIEFAWTGTAGIIVNRIPMIGRCSDNVYYAQGYSGHGIASSHIFAEVLADAIKGGSTVFDTLSTFKHIRLPLGRRGGAAALALGMMWYRLKERLG